MSRQSNQLPDGTIIPSNLQARASSQNVAKQYTTDRPALLRGSVLARYSPEDKNNWSKKFYEYDVLVTDSRRGSSGSIIVIPHCVAAGGFGNDSKTQTIREKSWVYVMCLNGSSTQGVIIGGVPIAKQEAVDGELKAESFNGVSQRIDDDGSWSVTQTGAQADDGAPKTDISGSEMRIAATGSIILNDATGERIVIDRESKTIKIESSGDVNSRAAEAWTVQADNVQLRAKTTVQIVAPEGFDISGGEDGASSPLIKGDQLNAALSELVMLFITFGPALIAATAAPTLASPMNPGLLTALQNWKARWADTETLLTPKATVTP